MLVRTGGRCTPPPSEADVGRNGIAGPLGSFAVSVEGRLGLGTGLRHGGNDKESGLSKYTLFIYIGYKV